MKNIIHKIKLLKQKESHDCVQTGAVQLLNFYKVNKSVDDIKSEVPVYIDSTGKPLGSSIGHIASYFISLGLKTTIHTSDIQLFDCTWKNFESGKTAQSLKQRQKHLKHAIYNSDTINVIVEGFKLFLKKKGLLKIVVVDEQYLYKLLTKGPIYAVINYQFLFDAPKFYYNIKTKKNTPDAIRGISNTHVVIISGYKKGSFLVLDPDSGKGKWILSGRLLGAYYLADIDLDSILITVSK